MFQLSTIARSRFSTAALLTTLLVATAAHAQEADVDSDGDGVFDDADAEPCNASVSARVYVPADRVYGMLLFEDTWPSRGDFDFNDAVIAYNQVLRYDSSARLTGVRLELSVLAAGAGNQNGLALRLPGTPASNVTSLTYSVGSVANGGQVTLDPNATDATVVLSEDLHALFGAEATRGFVNTDPNLPLLPYVDIVVELGLDPGVTLSAADAPFDLFIFNRWAGSEVHLPRYRGTSVMNAALYNTADDGSTPTRSFVTTGGIPFALELPELANYPQELAAIDVLYPGIVTFGSSGGTQATDFYRTAAAGTAFGLAQPKPLQAAAAADLSCFTPEPGVCGSATGTGSVSAPTTALCSFGAPSTVASSTGYWRWSCAGNYSTPTECTTPDWVCEPNQAYACPISGGTGTQTCNGSGTGYGTCVATSCNSGYYLSGSSCLAQVCTPGSTRSCTLTHGTGEQTCDNLGSAWSGCTAVSCNAGYAWNGVACADIDECATGTDTCSANATCTNTTGSYTCGCNQGYIGDGFTCEQCGRLESGQTIYPGQRMRTCNGAGELVVQADGNTVFYTRLGAVWSTGTNNSSVGHLTMQTDGNLVLYTNTNVAMWHSVTYGYGGAWLAVQDDCNLVIYRNGVVLWTSNTHGSCG